MRWKVVCLTLCLFSPATFANEDASEPNVKKSKNDICHDKSSRSYKRTKNYRVPSQRWTLTY